MYIKHKGEGSRARRKRDEGAKEKVDVDNE
jgi:hypothetical protein